MPKDNICKRRLILHAGACKTGTTSLQIYLARHSDGLRKRGILYPATGVLETQDLKHQWIVSALLMNDRSELSRRMAAVEDECDDTIHTVFLSTEGIFNHWWDYSNASKELFSVLGEHYDLYCWLWLREPVEFFKSYYLQAMRNPQVANIPAYGRPLDTSDFLEMPWVVKHLDYKSLITELKEAFGEDRVFIFSYTKDTVRQVCELLGIPDFITQTPDLREKTTVLNLAGLSLLKLVNQYPLSPDEKEAAYQSIASISAILAPHVGLLELTVEEVNNVMALCSLSTAELAQINQDSLSRWARIAVADRLSSSP